MTSTGYGGLVDRRSVVLQLGHSLTKIGFAGEPFPRAVVPTPQLRLRRFSALGQHLDMEAAEWEVALESALTMAFSMLHLPPSSRRIVVLENDFNCRSARQALCRLLFDKLSVPTINLLSAMAAPLYAQGISTGLIVDIGWDEVRVLPVGFGFPCRNAYRSSPTACCLVNNALKLELQSPNFYAGQSEHLRSLHNQLSFQGEIEKLKESDIQDIQVKCCYIRTAGPREHLNPHHNDNELDTTNGNQPVLLESGSEACVQVTPDLVLVIPAKLRWSIYEILFEGVLLEDTLVFADSIVTTIIRSLEALNVDVRKYVIENIVLCGGGAEIPGFVFRFAMELQSALRKNGSLKALEKVAQIARPCFAAWLLQWVGGAAAASLLDSAPNLAASSEYTRADWRDSVPLPDCMGPTVAHSTSDV